MSRPGRVNGRSNPFKPNVNMSSLFADARKRHEERVRKLNQNAQSGEPAQQPTRGSSSVDAQSRTDAPASSSSQTGPFDEIFTSQPPVSFPKADPPSDALPILDGSVDIRTSAGLTASEPAFLHTDGRWTNVFLAGNSWIVLNFTILEDSPIPIGLNCQGHHVRRESRLGSRLLKYSNDVRTVFNNIFNILSTLNSPLVKSKVEAATRHLDLKYDDLKHIPMSQGNEHIHTFDAKVWTLSVHVFPLYDKVEVGDREHLRLQQTLDNKDSIISGTIFVDRTQAYACEAAKESDEYRDIAGSRPDNKIRVLQYLNKEYVDWEHEYTVVTPLSQTGNLAQGFDNTDADAAVVKEVNSPIENMIIDCEVKKHATIPMPLCKHSYGNTTIWVRPL